MGTARIVQCCLGDTVSTEGETKKFVLSKSRLLLLRNMSEPPSQKPVNRQNPKLTSAAIHARHATFGAIKQGRLQAKCNSRSRHTGKGRRRNCHRWCSVPCAAAWE